MVSFWEKVNLMQADKEEVHLVREFKERLRYNLQQVCGTLTGCVLLCNIAWLHIQCIDMALVSYEPLPVLLLQYIDVMQCYASAAVSCDGCYMFMASRRIRCFAVKTGQCCSGILWSLKSCATCMLPYLLNSVALASVSDICQYS